MTVRAGRSYIEVPDLLAQAFTLLPVPRTGLPLASSQGTELTLLTRRVVYEDDLVNALPALVIDVNPQQSAKYRYQGSILEAGMPFVIAVYTPCSAYLTGLTRDQQRAAVLAADQDVKTLVGDIEAILNSTEARHRIGKHLELQSSRIAYDEVGFGAAGSVRARYAELWVTVWTVVPNHGS